MASAALAACLLAACGGGGSGASRVDQFEPAESLWAKAVPPEPQPLDDTPESYGLPPLDVLQANPGGVAQELFRRTAVSTWTVKWALYQDGKELAEMELASIPPRDGAPGQLFATGTMGTPDTHLARFDLLDRGAGAAMCAQTGTKPFVCESDLSSFDLKIDFLSVRGMGELGRLLRDALAIPGLTVQYLKIAGEPATCFYFPPMDIPASAASSLGVDFSEPGSFCLSREGALLQLDFDALDVIATSYRNTANTAMFTLPGDPP